VVGKRHGKNNMEPLGVDGRIILSGSARIELEFRLG